MMNYFTQSFMFNNDKNNDGIISLAEYQNYLKSQNMPLSMATRAMTIFEQNGSAGLSQQELLDAFTSFDNNTDGSLDFSENLDLQNVLSGTTIDTSINQNKYNSLLSNSINFFKSADKDGNSEATLAEIQNYLTANNLDSSTAAAFINFYNPGGTSFNLLQYQKKSIDMDLNKDGLLDAVEKYALTQANAVKPLSNLQISAQKLVSAVDGTEDNNGNVIKDGLISKAEYTEYLKKQNMPSGIADDLFATYSPTGTLSAAQLTNIYKSFDADSDGSLSFSESLTYQNSLSDVKIDTTTTANQYNSLLSSASVFFKSADTNKDGKINLVEYQKVLEFSNYDVNDAQDFINFYNQDADGEVNLLEYLSKSIALDTNKDGKLTSNTVDSTGQIVTGELNPLLSQLRQLSSIEVGAKNFLKAVDGTKDSKGKVTNQDGYINYSEYVTYLNNNKMPQNIALNVMDLAADTTKGISYNELVSAMQAFDDDKDGTLNFSEQLSFQNSISNIKFDTTIAQKQYTNLYKAGQSFIALDLNKDGDVSLEEYRAALLKPNAKTGATQPEYYAENLMMIFDQEVKDNNGSIIQAKDGKINLFEYMQGLMQFDKDNDGTLNAVESLNLKNTVDNTKLFDNVGEIITATDYNNDKLVSKDEYKDFLISEGLPAYLADEALVQFDTDKDGSLNRLELMQAYKQFDINNNNDLDINEKLSLYESLSQNTVNLGLNQSNIKQYTRMFEELQSYIQENDNDNNSLISATELRKYFADKNLPGYITDQAVALFDTANTLGAKDGNLDLLELMKMNLTYDVNTNGTLELNEELSLYEALSDVTLNATVSNENQYDSIYSELKEILAQFDADKDQALKEAELKNYFASKGFSENLVTGLTGILASYDANNDAQIDILELMKAYIDNDADESGKLELSEELTLNGSLADVDLNATVSNQKQYQGLYPYTTQNIQAFDKTSDQQLNASEFGDYFVSKGFSASLATEALNLYDANKNGSLDAFELLKANVDFDVNQNGSLEFNEVLAQNAKFAKIDLSAVAGNATLINGNFQAASNVLAGYDADKDNNLSTDETKAYFKAFGLPQYIADNFTTLYDSDKDGQLNNIELMKGFIDADSNKSGTLDFTETLNMFSTTAGVNVNVTEANLNQVNNLYSKEAVLDMNYYDANGDKKLSATELGQLFKTIGMPQYMADNFISQYDNNSDSSIDTIELLKGLMDSDLNQNGTMNFEDWMKIKSNTSGVNINITEANANQVANLYNKEAALDINFYDANGDKKLSATELGQMFKALGMPQYMADSLISQYDNNSDSSIDTMELLKVLMDSDLNQNGTMNFEDWMKIKSNTSGVNINITEANANQVANLYNKEAQLDINYYDASDDKKLSATELGQMFSAVGLSQADADNFIIQYDNNNDSSIDTIELLKGLVDFDQNQNGTMNFEDWMKIKG